VTLSPLMRRVLAISTGLALLFVYTPLALVVLNSFNTSRTFAWPPPGYTTEWWQAAWHSQGARDAVWVSVQVAIVATLVALVLGTMAALALQRFRFFGRDTVSLLIILPIALPGVVTGIALANFFTTMIGIKLGMFTLIVSHATFCIVTVFNNAVARLRRLGSNLEEASMDLGAGTFRTFYKITLPMLRSSLLAGGLLAFALSFDEIIVTTFTVGQGIQTLPIWIYQNLFRPNQAPVVNVVAAVLILASIVPIWLAQKLAGTDESVAAAR
jgi:putative spermidine/putrescine transport system permease protein